MPVKRQIAESDGVYFITFTCFNWLPLIEKTNGYDLIYNWFDHLKDKGHYLNGYVIMPNHVHAIIAFRNTGQSINTIIGNGKRFIAYEIINRLKVAGDDKLLHNLYINVEAKDRERNKKHEVWEDSFDWKECRANDFIRQKLDYIHNNPISGKWNLAASAVDYEHSSARFYLTGEQGIYPILDFCELADMNLTQPINSDAESAVHKARK